MKPGLQFYEVPRSKAVGASWGIDPIRVLEFLPTSLLGSHHCCLIHILWLQGCYMPTDHKYMVMMTCRCFRQDFHWITTASHFPRPPLCWLGGMVTRPATLILVTSQSLDMGMPPTRPQPQPWPNSNRTRHRLTTPRSRHSWTWCYLLATFMPAGHTTQGFWASATPSSIDLLCSLWLLPLPSSVVWMSVWMHHPPLSNSQVNMVLWIQHWKKIATPLSISGQERANLTQG